MHHELSLKTIPIDEIALWSGNAKKHDLDAIMRSIRRYGFAAPAKLDSELGAVVFGNGRIQALRAMAQSGEEAPRGVTVLDDGRWAVPILQGLDAESKDAAIAFGVDHNALTLAGSDLALVDTLQIWDEQALQDLLNESPDAAELLIAFDADDLSSLLNGPSFEPVGADEQGQLDEKKLKTCPECGHEF